MKKKFVGPKSYHTIIPTSNHLHFVNDAFFLLQQKPLSVGAKFAAKKSALWSEDPEPEKKRIPHTETESSSRSWKEQSTPVKARSKDFKVIDDHEEYQPTYRKDFIRKEPSPPSSSVNRELTPSSLLIDNEPKEEKSKSTAPQIDERSNRFGSLLRNFQKGAKSKDNEPASSKTPVGKIKVASIFDRDDPLEEEEKEKKISSIRGKGRESLPSSLSSISSSSVRTDISKKDGDLRPHV